MTILARCLFVFGFLWLAAIFFVQKPLMQASYISYESDIPLQDLYSRAEVRQITDGVQAKCEKSLCSPLLPAFLMLAGWSAEIFWIARRKRESRSASPSGENSAL